MKSNIDKAFIRRFETMVHFGVPGVEERYKLWTNGFSKHTTLEEEIDLHDLALKYEVSGGVIMNVVRYSSLMALKRDSNQIRWSDILVGIRREYLKEGKTL